MRIKEIISQHRRDFLCTAECEHCDHIARNVPGYDDKNFHENVVPTWVCPKCKERAGKNYRPLTTKYPEGFTV